MGYRFFKPMTRMSTSPLNIRAFFTIQLIVYLAYCSRFYTHTDSCNKPCCLRNMELLCSMCPFVVEDTHRMLAIVLPPERLNIVSYNLHVEQFASEFPRRSEEQKGFYSDNFTFNREWRNKECNESVRVEIANKK